MFRRMLFFLVTHLKGRAVQKDKRFRFVGLAPYLASQPSIHGGAKGEICTRITYRGERKYSFQLKPTHGRAAGRDFFDFESIDDVRQVLKDFEEYVARHHQPRVQSDVKVV